MNPIENQELLNRYLSEEEFLKLQAAATRYHVQSSMAFSIKLIEDSRIRISTIQNEMPSGHYAIEATLVKRTEDLFKKFFPGFSIIVTAQTYLPSPALVVNPQWIAKRMEDKGLKIKQVAFDTGIDRQSLSDWITGKRSMSQIVKALFYFYLSK